MQNLAKVNEDMNLGLSQEEIRKILLCCSSRGDKISFNEFYQIMTRDNEGYLKGMGDTANNMTTTDSKANQLQVPAATNAAKTVAANNPSALD